mgnify:CR=1 FL=1
MTIQEIQIIGFFVMWLLSFLTIMVDTEINSYKYSKMNLHYIIAIIPIANIFFAVYMVYRGTKHFIKNGKTKDEL